MESPLKKRKESSQESHASKVTSTPQRQSENCCDFSPTISTITDDGTSSSSSASRIVPGGGLAPRSLQFVLEKNKTNTDVSSLLDGILNSSGADEETIAVAEDGDTLDYDDFFLNLRRFQRKGQAWNLYKPIGDELGSLYHQILNNPQDAQETAEWLVQYCCKKPVYVGIFILFKFCLDCAGYQKFNLKKYFHYPTDVNIIMQKVDNNKCQAEVFESHKFLLADKAHVSQILRMGIFNLLQKFVLQAHNKDLLYEPQFVYLLKLVIAMCGAHYRQLVYTGLFFNLKLLTAICMVKEKVTKHSINDEQMTLLDNYINTLYVNFNKTRQLIDKECAPIKIACINELRIWIHYSAQVFIDHYDCISFINRLLLDEAKSVRLANLETCQKLLQNESLVQYLKNRPINTLVDYIFDRFCDVDIHVAQKAIEVYTSMTTYYFDIIQNRKKIFEVLIETIYHNDYRLATKACNCLLQILLKDDNDDNALLLNICKIAKSFHPELKPLLVEACMDNTTLLQKWSLIVELFTNPEYNIILVETKAVLSEILLETVHQTLTGISSKPRQFSRRVKEVDPSNHKIIADELVPSLLYVLIHYRSDPMIPSNFLKIVTKISFDGIAEDHIIIQCFGETLLKLGKLFARWNDTELLQSLLDFLLYVIKNLPGMDEPCKQCIKDLKECWSEYLITSLETTNNRTAIVARKVSILFSKFDLNPYIEWPKLLVSWDVMESNIEFVEAMMKCCHWSLIWNIKKLSSSELSTTDQNQIISSLSYNSKQFFSNCFEIMGNEELNLKFIAFEIICATYLSFSMELENISKQIRTLESIKPTLQDDLILLEQFMHTFELHVTYKEADITHYRKYAMYIVNMCFLGILPMEYISILFKYYNTHNAIYGKVIEFTLSQITQLSENWVPMLVVNTICICYERLIDKHGVVEIRSQETKDILGLSKKFAQFIKMPKLLLKLIFFAINYAAERKSYDFLIFVRVFTDEIQHQGDKCKELLDHLKRKIPKADHKNDLVLYLGNHLVKFATQSAARAPKAPVRKVRPQKENIPPKLKIKTTKVKKTPKLKENIPKQKNSQSTETDVTNDNMTIHDSSSDDMDLNPSNSDITS